VTARAGGKQTGDVRIGDDPVLGNRLENTGSRNLNGAAGIGYIGDRAVAGGAFRVYDFRYGLPAPPGADPVDIRGRRYELSGRAELTLASPLFPSLRVEGTAQGYVHDEIDAPSDAVQQSFALKTQTVNLLLRQGAHGLPTTGAWGVSGLFKDYTATGEAALTPAALSRSVGLFGFQELTLVEGGPTLQLGGRYDVYRIESKTSAKFGAGQGNDYRAFSGSLGFSIPLAEGISLGGSLARSFRAPTVEELFSGAYHAGTGTVELGDPTLRAERGRGMEAVLRVRNGSVNGQVAAYRNMIDNFVYMAALGDTLIGGAEVQAIGYTQQRATLAGVEGSLEWAVRRQLVVALMGDMIRATLRDGTPVSFIPPTRLGGEIRWDNGTFSLGGNVHHEFRQDRVGAADERPTDAHTVVRLTAGVRKTAGGVTHSLAVRGENLANELHREATSRIKDFAPNPGRNISVVYRVYF
jgi:iron complex outermembrane receptor protein